MILPRSDLDAEFGETTPVDVRAQSDVVGVALLTAVVVIAVGVAGAVYLGGFTDDAESTTPLLEVDVSLTDSTVQAAHAGGDSLAMTDLAVVLDGDSSRSRYDLDRANVSDDADDVFEPGEAWTREHGLSGRTATVLVVHEPSNAVVVREHVTVPTPTPDAAPDAALSTDATHPAPGDVVEFDASGSTDDGAIVAYRWDWEGDGTVDDTTNDSMVTHTYGSSGTYAATVEVVDDVGQTDRATVTIPVGVDPTASFTTSTTYPEPGDVITVDASGSAPGAGRITTYEWDWTSDGTFDDDGETATHSYASAGTYEITLRVTNDAGERNTTSRSVTVTEAPEPSFTYDPATPDTGDAVAFDASDSSDPDGAIGSYEWDFDGDGSVDATGETVTYTFTEHGDRSVTLTVTDDAGSTGSTSETVPVNAPPNAAFTWELDADDTVTLDGSASNDPDGTIESYDWAIEGCEWLCSRSGETVTEDRGSDESSSVSLTVEDDDGATDTVTKDIPYTLDVSVPGFGTGAALVAVLLGGFERRRGYI